MIVIHGGSWVCGNRLDYGTKRWLNDWLAGLGYAVASIDYRLSPQFKWPAQRDDLLAAIRFLRDHAAALGIDGIGSCCSAGRRAAQMATAAAYAEVIPGVRGIVDIYGPTDFDLTWDVATRPRSLDHRYNLEMFLGGSPETARAAYQSASGAMLVTPRAPPTLILHGGLDINVFPEQAELLGPEPRRRRRAARAGVAAVGRPRIRPGPLRHARRRSKGMRSRGSWRASRGDRARRPRAERPHNHASRRTQP